MTVSERVSVVRIGRVVWCACRRVFDVMGEGIGCH